MAGVTELKTARQKNATEIVHVGPNGEIYEGMTSNFMAIIDGAIVIPKDHILQGITKQVIKDIAATEGIMYTERDMNISEISTFQEAFMTASNKEVMPVHHIDDTQISDGTVGPVTKRLIESYRSLTRT